MNEQIIRPAIFRITFLISAKIAKSKMKENQNEKESFSLEVRSI